MSFLSFATHVATFSLPVPLRKSGRSREGWWGGVSTLPPPLHPHPPPTPPPPPPSLVLLCPEEGGGCLLRTIRDFPGGSQDSRAVCCLPLAMFSHYLHDLGDVGQVPPYFFLVIYLFVWLHWVILVLTATKSSPTCGEQASRCGGFSCCGEQVLGAKASVVAALGLSSCGLRAIECGLSCGTRA